MYSSEVDAIHDRVEFGLQSGISVTSSCIIVTYSRCWPELNRWRNIDWNYMESVAGNISMPPSATGMDRRDAGRCSPSNADADVKMQ